MYQFLRMVFLLNKDSNMNNIQSEEKIIQDLNNALSHKDFQILTIDQKKYLGEIKKWQEDSKKTLSESDKIVRKLNIKFD